MPVPYRSDEVAEAVMAAVRRAGIPIDRLEVVADERSGTWLIHARRADGSERRLTFPFASRAGIYSPAEIAAHVARESWPFRWGRSADPPASPRDRVAREDKVAREDGEL